MNAGTDLARDIQTGFLNRLALTPMRGSALIAGHSPASSSSGWSRPSSTSPSASFVGVDFASGGGGIAVLLLFAALVSLGFGALGTYLALRTGSGEAIQGLFPLLFVFLFLSSMNAPRDLIEVEWFRRRVDQSGLVPDRGGRSLIITGWDAQALALGFGMAIVIAVVGLALAASALETRLTRT